jgi:hypothetical protein
MALVNSGAHSVHVKIIRCDIKRESLEKFRDVQMSQFQEGIPVGLIVQTPPYFLNTEDYIFNI